MFGLRGASLQELLNKHIYTVGEKRREHEATERLFGINVAGAWRDMNARGERRRSGNGEHPRPERSGGLTRTRISVSITQRHSSLCNGIGMTSTRDLFQVGLGSAVIIEGPSCQIARASFTYKQLTPINIDTDPQEASDRRQRRRGSASTSRRRAAGGPFQNQPKRGRRTSIACPGRGRSGVARPRIPRCGRPRTPRSRGAGREITTQARPPAASIWVAPGPTPRQAGAPPPPAHQREGRHTGARHA